MTRKIRVGIIGARFGASVHAPAFSRDSRALVVALAAKRLDNARKAVSTMKGVQAYGDWRRMLKEQNLDAVSIAVPPKQQPAIAIEALQQGVAVFAEKPMAARLVDARRMTDIAVKHRAKTMVDYELMGVPEWILTKKMLQSGAIGKLRHIAVSWRVETYANKHKLISWKTRSTEGGGALSSFGCHALHALEWFAGPVQKLSTHLSQALDLPSKGDSLCLINTQLKSGSTARIEICTHAFPATGHEWQFFGDEGQLRLVNRTEDYVRGFELSLADRKKPAFRSIKPTDSYRTKQGDGRVEAVSWMIKRFLDGVATKKQVDPDFKSAFRVEQLLEAARLSAKKNSSFVRVL